MARIVVIGGGLAGLCAAHKLTRMQHRVLVVEGSARWGGQIHTEKHAGYVVELGAEGYVARSEALPKLARELGVEAQLVGQLETRSLGYRGGALQQLEPGESASFLGFQVAKGDLGQGIRTLKNGMGALIDALANKLAGTVELRSGFRVQHIERRARGYAVHAEAGVLVQADRVVVATSARAAAPVLSPVVGSAANDLSRATAHSSVNVSLAYPREAIAHPQPMDATGCVFANEDQLHGSRACVFASSKFAGRAPEHGVNLRVFFRPDPRELKMLADTTYVNRAREVLERILGPLGAPLHSWVARWPDALPVFDESSKRIIADLEIALKGSGIALASSAFHGTGVDGAVRSGLSIDQRL